jgi:DNA-binding NtrC family response regulator
MPTILIVDDDAVVRGLLLELLSEAYECNTASTAEEAIEFLNIEHYDAVVTDIAMPLLNGIGLLKRIQSKGLGTPVIVMSGKGDEQDSQSLLKLGAFAYLTKPFDLEQMENVVQQAVKAGLAVRSRHN